MCSKAGPGMKQSVAGHQIRGKATCPCLFNQLYRLGLLGLLSLSSTSSNEGSADNSLSEATGQIQIHLEVASWWFYDCIYKSRTFANHLEKLELIYLQRPWFQPCHRRPVLSWGWWQSGLHRIKLHPGNDAGWKWIKSRANKMSIMKKGPTLTQA